MKNVVQGAVVRITGTFKSFAGALADPTVVMFMVRSESDDVFDSYIYGEVGSPIVKSSTGVYYFDQDTSDEPGLYSWRIVGTGTAPGSRQGKFFVEPMDPDDESSEFSS